MGGINKFYEFFWKLGVYSAPSLALSGRQREWENREFWDVDWEADSV